MALTTRFTALLGVRHPIALAPMGGSAGGALAAAVSAGGGLGLLGAGDHAWLDRELPILRDRLRAAGRPAATTDQPAAGRSATADERAGAGTPWGSTPVLAAGGIADGRGIGAALALGADGALLGTRFQATPETLAHPTIIKAVLAGRGADTERSSILDVVRGSSWPAKYTARTLAHPHLDRWRGREPELTASPRAKQDYADDVERGLIPPLPVWAGEAVDLITGLSPAADLVEDLAAQAETALHRPTTGSERDRNPPP